MDNFDFDTPTNALPEQKRKGFGQHPTKPSSRVFGIVMVVAALAWLFYSVGIWDTEINRLKAMGDFKDPYYYFVNPQELTGGLSLIGSLQGFAGILIILGVYRIIFSRKSTWLVFVAFPICFGIIIAQAFYINGIREEVQKTVLSNQHTWAEERYGVTYDEITLKVVKANETRNYKVQDEVKKDGETIASVCEAENRQSTYFCETGTSTELSTAAYSPESSEYQEEETVLPEYEDSNGFIEGEYSSE